MSSDFAIRVKNISKYYQIYDKPLDRLKQSLWRGRKQFYREFRALDDVSFDVKKGETVGIIGRNGSGKSTLLQIVCGTLAPTSGKIEVEGRVAALLELGAGFSPEFTGKENVYMNASILGLSREEIDANYEDIVAFADIGGFIDQPVKTYSSGMYVRLAFSVIIHVDADILVIDEALSVGDVFFTQKCMRFLRNFMNKGTVLFVSHDSSAIMNLCLNSVWLGAGRSRMVADSKTVCEKYLEDSYAEHQEIHTEKNQKNIEIESPDFLQERTQDTPVDGRLAFINSTQYRNDLELFQFNLNADQFGEASVCIKNIEIRNENGEPLGWVVGGELVKLYIEAIALKDLDSIIVGFFIKDRLGQTLFGDNTYLSCLNKQIYLVEKQCFFSSFTFRMPILPLGDYSITVAVANGTQDEQVQCSWVHDAMVFKSHASSVSTGLIGIPMLNIQLQGKG